MPIHITNSLSGKKEVFEPMIPGKVKMYVCGPTVYNFIHIGNARPFVFFDVVERYLKFSGYDVTRVMNYTDVDDKIIDKARSEKTNCSTINDRYIAEFLTDMNLLGVKAPAVAPRVTDHIPEIIQIISGLIKNGLAYVVEDGEVLYSVRSFKDYGKLSGKNIDDLLSGARVQPGEKKRDPLDFSLWKPQKKEDEPAWDSPWGKGRPGWHIECSAMAIKYLGETFDIHGGGRDLIHPHHENEIAQSEGFSKKQYVRYWMHNNMLTFNSEKMSKSIGNIILTREFISLYSAETLRFFLLSGQYRSTIDYSEKHIREVQSALHRFYSTALKCKSIVDAKNPLDTKATTEEAELNRFGLEFESVWKQALDDDFNTAKVIGIVFEYIRKLNAYIDKKSFKTTAESLKICKQFQTNITTLSSVLNLFGEKPDTYLALLRNLIIKEKGITESEILDFILQRKTARQNKDFKKADEIRSQLLSKGIELRDKGNETDWDVVFSSNG